MRLDKLTTAFQQALQDAQSLPWRATTPTSSPAHLLAAMLQQPDGPRPLLERAGAKVSALDTAMETCHPQPAHACRVAGSPCSPGAT
jgi:ATP-dependent Clp protease ATP-binding subunit ClpB